MVVLGGEAVSYELDTLGITTPFSVQHPTKVTGERSTSSGPQRTASWTRPSTRRNSSPPRPPRSASARCCPSFSQKCFPLVSLRCYFSASLRYYPSASLRCYPFLIHTEVLPIMNYHSSFPCRASLVEISQSRPDSGNGLQAKAPNVAGLRGQRAGPDHPRGATLRRGGRRPRPQ